MKVDLSDIAPPRCPPKDQEPNDLKVRRSLCPRCGRDEIQNQSGFCSPCLRAKRAAKRAAVAEAGYRLRKEGE